MFSIPRSRVLRTVSSTSFPASWRAATIPASALHECCSTAPPGDPKGVERMGIVLEPEADDELSDSGGGCEDPRISLVEPLQHYVMM